MQVNEFTTGKVSDTLQSEVALFLASDAASYIHGQAIAVDGGLSSSHPTARRPGDLRAGAAW